MKVGVVGAGVMGCGVAATLAQFEHDVVLIDASNAIWPRAQEEIIKNVRMAALLGKAKLPDTSHLLERIHFSIDYAALQGLSFIVENITEKWEDKVVAHQSIAALGLADCVVAVNTSAIPITRVAGLYPDPSRIIGMHFMNPVPVKPLVEVIRGFHTSDDTISRAKQMLKGIGKDCVVVQDLPGFVSNRVLMLMINEAVFLVQDGVASAAEVDRIFRECFSHKMGPLETADLIGLDTILNSIVVLYENYKDSKYRPCPLLQKMVDAGLYGVKNGRGFYSYKARGAFQ